MKIRLLASARNDIREIGFTYHAERPVLGDEFLDELKEVLAGISEMPLSFPKITSHARRALLERFPYAVYFELAANRSIVVVGVFHQRRDPRTIARRIQH